ncbi:MAG: hypothetical protein H6581_04195 [Bacteroidia bacterium]|nr:hypothetical protein [Bacteroidia bacterium]
MLNSINQWPTSNHFLVFGNDSLVIKDSDGDVETFPIPTSPGSTQVVQISIVEDNDGVENFAVNCIQFPVTDNGIMESSINLGMGGTLIFGTQMGVDNKIAKARFPSSRLKEAEFELGLNHSLFLRFNASTNVILIGSEAYSFEFIPVN